MLNQYETVFILHPVLSEEQIKETVKKFRDLLKAGGAKIVSAEDWGLRKLAYPIQKKRSGFYHLIEFKAPGSLIASFETELCRDERIMRFLIVRMDKYHVEYAEKRRKRLSNQKQEA